MIQIEKYQAGEIIKSFDYKYFLPTLINKEWTWSDPKVTKLLKKIK